MAANETPEKKWKTQGWAFLAALEHAANLLAVLSVIIAAGLWIWEADDRDKQKHYRAWELINSARGSTGDGGRRDALQDLNEDKVSLIAAPLAKAYLAAVQLPSAKLIGADLTEAILTNANLIGAILTNANLAEAELIGATLTRANLTNSNLFNTNLFGTDLSEADLTGANLVRANLTGADLTGAKLIATDLTEANLVRAKLVGTNLAIFCRTRMPDGTVNNRHCPPEPEPTQPAPPTPGEETSAPE
jgi:hypothetical protein